MAEEQPFLVDKNRIPEVKKYNCEGKCPNCGGDSYSYVDDDGGGDGDSSWVTFKCEIVDANSQSTPIVCILIRK